MLKEFKVRNYMNFQDELVFSLADDKKYDFNGHVIKNKIVKNAVIVGDNATGKSNLGRAILDITNHLTDNTRNGIADGVYTNLFTPDPEAHFSYVFQFGEHTVCYRYDKKTEDVVTREVLLIDGKEVIKNSNNEMFVKLKGAEHLNMRENVNSLSLVKYAYGNTILDTNDVESKIFLEFIEFVQGMLFVPIAREGGYAGFSNAHGNILKFICKLDNGATGLQYFLSDLGIYFDLVQVEDSDGDNIYCRYNEKTIPFGKLMSSGTRALIYFYYWYMQNNKIKFLYLDEFDAFYHTGLSQKILNMLIRLDNVQVVVSTHNTDMLSNEILRPDCYFELKSNEIKPFYKKTGKALREAHNLQKMYKAGAFNE